MDNIIQFPVKNDTKNFPLNLEQSYEHIEEVRKDYCEEIGSDAMEAVFSVLSSYGITIKPDEDAVKIIVFVEEAIKALIYNTKNLHHPFQKLSQEVINLTDGAHEELRDIIERNSVDNLNE